MWWFNYTRGEAGQRCVHQPLALKYVKNFFCVSQQWRCPQILCDCPDSSCDFNVPVRPSSFQCTTLNSWCMPPLAPNAKVLHCFPNDTAKEHSKQTRSEVCPNSFLLTSHANCAGAKLLMTVSCKGIKPRTTGTRSPPTPRWARCRVTNAALMGQSATSRAGNEPSRRLKFHNHRESPG